MRCLCSGLAARPAFLNCSKNPAVYPAGRDEGSFSIFYALRTGAPGGMAVRRAVYRRLRRSARNLP